MFSHLWTKGHAPPEYLEFVLCDRFGWTPAELRAQRASDVMNFLTIMDVEGKVAKQRAGGKHGR